MINTLNQPLLSGSTDFTGQPKPQNLEQAADQFEVMFLRQVLQEMRKSADVFADEDGVFSSREARRMRDFYDDALAQELASQRSSGIASLLVQQLSTPAAEK